MEQTEQKKGSKTALMVLAIIVVGLLGYIAYDKLISTNTKTIESPANDTSITPGTTPTVTINDVFNSLVGTYTFGKINQTPKCDGTNNEIDGTSYGELTLNSNGTYTYNFGTYCGSGYKTKGTYTLGINKIVLYNADCQPYYISENENKKCDYPNCNQIIELPYENGKISNKPLSGSDDTKWEYVKQN